MNHNACMFLLSARDPRAPFEVIRLYLEAGGKTDKCIMSHLDRKLKQKRISITCKKNLIVILNAYQFV